MIHTNTIPVTNPTIQHNCRLTWPVSNYTAWVHSHDTAVPCSAVKRTTYIPVKCEK